MGVVFSAYDPKLDRKVALKLLRSGLGVASSDARARLRREAQAKEREEELRATIGEADLAELRRVKAWLLAHPERVTMYALLHPDHPL